MRTLYWFTAVLVGCLLWLSRHTLRRWLVPDNFDKSPYGFVANQIAHIAVGSGMVFFASYAGFLMLGEYPYRIEIFLIVLALVLFFECAIQPLNGWDTFNDIVFMAVWGAGGTLLVFEELHAGTALITGNPVFAIGPIIGATAHLAAGAWHRL